MKKAEFVVVIQNLVEHSEYGTVGSNNAVRIVPTYSSYVPLKKGILATFSAIN